MLLRLALNTINQSIDQSINQSIKVLDWKLQDMSSIKLMIPPKTLDIMKIATTS